MSSTEKMKTFILKPFGKFRERLGWDNTLGMVVRAKNETNARELAFQELKGDFGGETVFHGKDQVKECDFWLDPESVECKDTEEFAEHGVLMIDFRYG